MDIDVGRSCAETLDHNDPLADLRKRFVEIPDRDVVAYLDGNSLGRPLRTTRERLLHAVDVEWASRLIRSWGDSWLHLPERVGDLIASAALGAAPGRTVVGDSTTVSFYKAMRAALSLRPERREIVADTANFPTDRYVVHAIAADLGLTVRWIEADPWSAVTPEQVAAVVGPQTAVVTLSHVNYRSAGITDMTAVTQVAHAAGALVVWDLCHSVGALPLELDTAEIDFAVGCTYKFLCAGPGAPAFLYARADHIPEVALPLPGWMGTDDVYEMSDAFRPAPGIRRFLSGTPAVLGLLGVEEGARLVAEAGIDRIRAKSIDLTTLAITLVDEWLAPLGYTLATPREPAVRGSHVTVRHPHALELCGQLEKAGVIADFRKPDGIRLGLSPLSTAFTELWDAIHVIKEITRGDR